MASHASSAVDRRSDDGPDRELAFLAKRKRLVAVFAEEFFALGVHDLLVLHELAKAVVVVVLLRVIRERDPVPAAHAVVEGEALEA